MKSILRFIAMAATAFAACTCHAGTFRAYVSIVGNDANPCSLGAPCRLLGAAMAAVNDGGEIWMMDSGNFNTATVVVDRSVAIFAIPGAVASIFAINGPAFTVNSASATLTLKNVVIKSLAGFGSTSGVQVASAARLVIEDVTIADLPGDAIAVSGPAKIQLNNVTLRNNDVGIRLENGPDAAIIRSIFIGNATAGIVANAGTASATHVSTSFAVQESSFTGNGIGVSAFVQGPSVASGGVTRSQFIGNATGVSAAYPGAVGGGGLRIALASNVLVNHTQAAVLATGSGADVLIHDNVIYSNSVGVSAVQGGRVKTTTSNAVDGNNPDVDGALTSLGKM